MQEELARPKKPEPNISHTQTLAKCALLIALLTVSCFFTISLGPVPFTLQTAVVILIALLCTPGEAAATVGIYLLMGAIGLPVFSGMTGGIIRASTGFLAGFLVGAVLASLIFNFLQKKSVPALGAGVAAAALYMVIADVMGLAWYCFFAQVGIAEAAAVMVAPFVVVDCLKAVFALVVAQAVRSALLH